VYRARPDSTHLTTVSNGPDADFPASRGQPPGTVPHQATPSPPDTPAARTRTNQGIPALTAGHPELVSRVQDQLLSTRPLRSSSLSRNPAQPPSRPLPNSVSGSGWPYPSQRNQLLLLLGPAAQNWKICA
jgi:hypothetical protein